MLCDKAGIDRAMLYDIFAGKRVPRVDTLAKILKTLGYNLKVA
ncbi:helix-turn-helix transcriptional regulator [bacterium]|nr:helix-turn-helix transcriptional regulator [bacterium]